MIILDSLLIGGIRFVLGKVAAAVEAELNDDTALREELLAAQMRLELGEISEAEFARIEAEVLARLREIRERQRGGPAPPPGELRVTGVEAHATFDAPPEAPSPEPPRAAADVADAPPAGKARGRSRRQRPAQSRRAGGR